MTQRDGRKEGHNEPPAKRRSWPKEDRQTQLEQNKTEPRPGPSQKKRSRLEEGQNPWSGTPQGVKTVQLAPTKVSLPGKVIDFGRLWLTDP